MGFSLIELIIVIILLSIIAAFVSGRWSGTNINLNAEAQQLARTIRYTQFLAMTQGQRYRVNFTTTNYSMTDLSGNVVTDPVKGSNTILYSSGDSVVYNNLTNNVLAFDGMGTPYIDTTAVTPLAINATITLSSGGMTRTITITPTTGRIIVQ